MPCSARRRHHYLGAVKSGLTWTQRLVSLLVFDGPGLPGPAPTVSRGSTRPFGPSRKWVATLDALASPVHQDHTPLDGPQLSSRQLHLRRTRPAHAAVSMLAQSANMNEDRMRILHEAVVPFHRRIAPFAEQIMRSPTRRDWMEGRISSPGIGLHI